MLHVVWFAFACAALTADVSAVVERPVHPLLVRNEHSPLARVTLDVPADGGPTRLESLAFSFADSDDPSDLEALRLFATAEKPEFATNRPLGDWTPSAKHVTLPAGAELRPGKNVFWLAARVAPRADLLHRVSVACSAVETNAGRVAPRDANPSQRFRLGVALRRHRDDDVHTYRIPAFTTTARGALLCVYDMRRRAGRDLQEDIDIGLSRSVDGGRTWEPVRVIMDMGEHGGFPQEQNGCSDPGIVVDRQTGEIFCFALWLTGKPGKHQWVDDGSEPGFEIGKTAQFLVVRSRDDGVTWSRPENLTRQLKQESWWLFAPAPQAGMQLADGTLVMPVQGRTGRGKLETFATIMTSADHGRTWNVGEPAYRGGNECQAATLSDGSIMLNIRNDHERFRAVAVTADRGRTWRAHETSRTTLVEPNCNGSLLSLDVPRDGRTRHLLLFANPHSQKGRTHQTIQASFDDGRTWPESRHVLLDEGRGAGYPSLARLDADHVGIVYEGSQSQLVFQKFRVAEWLD